jgi:hypothetical protein
MLVVAVLVLTLTTGTARAAEFVAEHSTETFTAQGVEGEETQTFSFSNGDSVTCSKVKSESGSGTFPAKTFKATLHYEGCTGKLESKEMTMEVSCAPSTFEVGEGEVEEGAIAGSVTFGACTFTAPSCTKECTIKMASQKYTGVTFVDQGEEMLVKFALKEGEYEATCPSAKEKGASYSGVIAMLGNTFLQVAQQYIFVKRMGAYPVEETSAQSSHVFTFNNAMGVEQEKVTCSETTYKSKLAGRRFTLWVVPSFKGTNVCSNAAAEKVEVAQANCNFYFERLAALGAEKFSAILFISAPLNSMKTCKFTVKNNASGCERIITAPQRLKGPTIENLNAKEEIEIVVKVTGLADSANAACPEKAGNFTKTEYSGTSLLKRLKIEKF